MSCHLLDRCRVRTTAMKNQQASLPPPNLWIHKVLYGKGSMEGGPHTVPQTDTGAHV